MMVCGADSGTVKIKMIDLDTLKSKEHYCDDYVTIGESIFFCLVQRHRAHENYEANVQQIRAIGSSLELDEKLKDEIRGR